MRNADQYIQDAIRHIAGWDKMTRPQRLVAFARYVCNDASVGYSQRHRWLDPDVDCSSFMLLCAYAAGYPVSIGWGYTGSMVATFIAAGFEARRWDGNWGPLPDGTIMLNTTHHTEMIVDDAYFAGAHIDELGGIAGDTGGDQTGGEVSIVKIYEYWAGWDYALVPPSEGSAPAPSPGSSLSEIAREVIAGLWGSGQERKDRLTAAGHDYTAVQTWVNEILARGNESAGNVTPAPDLDTVAWAVIRGEYGVGQDRISRLTAAGYDAAAVQARVNELLK
jgi:hypothetical protein